MSFDHHSEELTAIRTDLGAIFVSMELSRSTWLITSLSPGGGEKMSKRSVSAGDIPALLARFADLNQQALARTGKSFPFIVIQEAGLDGFWIHRKLEDEGIESWVVDSASIATSRRRRRAKTDRIDGEALLRALLAYKRGEPRVCAMVRAPTPEEEDNRRLCRERKTLVAERIEHVNRIKGLLFSQGVSDYEPLRANRRQRLDALKTGDGRALPPHMKTQIGRELDRLELLINQIKAVEKERDAAGRERCSASAASNRQWRTWACDVDGVQWNRRRDHRRFVVGRVLQKFRQSKTDRRLCGPGGDALAKRLGCAGTRRVQSRQPTPAHDDDRTCLAMATTPTGFSLVALVP